MEVQYLIKNGTVVDGSGAPAFRGDLRVRRGRIAQIAPSLSLDGRERVIDATDCYVTPGFVETHNHWDAGVWWAPLMEPLPAYGATTSINGNCGFSPAPSHRDARVRQEMIDIFNYFEDIPEEAQRDFHSVELAQMERIQNLHGAAREGAAQLCGLLRSYSASVDGDGT